MSDTQPIYGPQEAVEASTILARVSSALLLFSAVFAGVLLLSWFFLLPRLTQLKLQGQTVSISAILPYEQRLRADITKLEEERTALVLPVQDATYDALKVHTQCYPLPQDALHTLHAAALQMGENVAHIASATFVQNGSVLLKGEVRNVGPRSMTVLAQFVKEVEKLPMVEDVTTPAFTRESAAGGYVSPFEFTLTLKPSSECAPV
jgi:hypothetical protein